MVYVESRRDAYCGLCIDMPSPSLYWFCRATSDPIQWMFGCEMLGWGECQLEKPIHKKAGRLWRSCRIGLTPIAVSRGVAFALVLQAYWLVKRILVAFMMLGGELLLQGQGSWRHVEESLLQIYNMGIDLIDRITFSLRSLYDRARAIVWLYGVVGLLMSFPVNLHESLRGPTCSFPYIFLYWGGM